MNEVRCIKRVNSFWYISCVDIGQYILKKECLLRCTVIEFGEGGYNMPFAFWWMTRKLGVLIKLNILVEQNQSIIIPVLFICFKYYTCLFFKKKIMLNIIMKIDISVRLTFQILIIICHHIKILLWKKIKRIHNYYVKSVLKLVLW